MQAMRSLRILVMAEGMMERLFINNNFPYASLIPLQNGAGWSVDRLCEQIASKYFIKNIDVDKVIVWLDREKQSCDPDEFCERIASALEARGAKREKVAICLADRMSENMILADEEVISTEFDSLDYSYSHEGDNGKRVLQDFYRAKGINYKETIHGALLLKRIRLARCAQKSAFSKRFLDSLGLECWWVDDVS